MAAINTTASAVCTTSLNEGMKTEASTCEVYTMQAPATRNKRSCEASCDPQSGLVTCNQRTKFHRFVGDQQHLRLDAEEREQNFDAQETTEVVSARSNSLGEATVCNEGGPDNAKHTGVAEGTPTDVQQEPISETCGFVISADDAMVKGNQSDTAGCLETTNMQHSRCADSASFNEAHLEPKQEVEVASSPLYSSESHGKQTESTGFILTNDWKPLRFFVGGLPHSSTENEVALHFSQYGEVSDVTIARDCYTGRTRGFAFVTMVDSSSKERIFQGYHEFNGKKVDVREENNTMPADINRKIFVGGLDPSWREPEIIYYFKHFGEVEMVHIVNDGNGKSRCFGFVTFTSAEATNKVLENVMHHMLDRTVEVRRAEPKKRTANRTMGPFYQNWCEVPQWYMPEYYNYGEFVYANYPQYWNGQMLCGNFNVPTQAELYSTAALLDSSSAMKMPQIAAATTSVGSDTAKWYQTAAGCAAYAPHAYYGVSHLVNTSQQYMQYYNQLMNSQTMFPVNAATGLEATTKAEQAQLQPCVGMEEKGYSASGAPEAQANEENATEGSAV